MYLELDIAVHFDNFFETVKDLLYGYEIHEIKITPIGPNGWPVLRVYADQGTLESILTSYLAVEQSGLTADDIITHIIDRPTKAWVAHVSTANDAWVTMPVSLAPIDVDEAYTARCAEFCLDLGVIDSADEIGECDITVVETTLE
jgi:hypothetical protein